MLPEVVVYGRSDNLVGVADSANQGVVGQEQLSLRPLLRPGEVLETVPGVVITQHSGAGKANQFFVRGFNLDHGTDLATSVNGVPINLPSHGHGQGYTDLNFLMPELIERVEYRKGPYFADVGDFGSAGAIDINYVNTLDRGIASFEAGSYGYARAFLADSFALGGGNLLYGLELFHEDGPWDVPDAQKKINGVLRYSGGNADTGFSVSVLAYHSDWAATDQVAERAIDTGLIGRFGSLNTSDGGNSQRYMLVAEGHDRTEDGFTKIVGYTQYYDLDLFSDFTYFQADPINGDQFEQQDRRVISGLHAFHTFNGTLNGRTSDTTVGLQFRNDTISNGLYATADRQRLSTTRQDDIVETSFGIYVENRTQWMEKFRTVAVARGDFYWFDVDSDNNANSGVTSSGIFSPKISLIFGP